MTSALSAFSQQVKSLHASMLPYFSSPSAIACSAVHFIEAIRFLMAVTNVSTFNIKYPNPHETLLYYIYFSLI